MHAATALALFLAGSAGHDLASEAAVKHTYLVCGSAIRLDISHDGRSAIVRGERSESVLKRANSQLGSRYEGEGVAIMRSGDIYLYLDQSGASTPCDPLPR